MVHPVKEPCSHGTQSANPQSAGTDHKLDRSSGMSTPKETDSIHKEILGSGIADILTAPFKDAFGKVVGGKSHDNGPNKAAIVAPVIGRMLESYQGITKLMECRW